jgi:hypothetical protein
MVIGPRLDRMVRSDRPAAAIQRPLSIPPTRRQPVTVFPSGNVHGNYRELRHLSRSTDTDKQTAVFYCGAAEEIGGALKFLVEISSPVQEQVPRVVFVVSVVCSDCTPPPDEAKDDPAIGVPAPDPAYLAKLDHLFAFASGSGRRRARRMRHKNLPTNFLRNSRNWWPHS